MKTRNGFVSNSSSSSFIVAFPHKPTSIEEVQKMMFTDYQKTRNYYDSSVSCDEIVEQVWNDINLEEHNEEDIRGLFDNMYWHYGYVWCSKDTYKIFNVDDRYIFQDNKLKWEYLELFEKREKLIFPHNGFEQDKKDYYDKYQEIADKLREIADKCFEIDYAFLLEEWKDRYIRIFSYSDNDGEKFSVMEHGNIFLNLDSIEINQH